jgi:hypothetical protein
LVSLDIACTQASRIPDARLSVLEGETTPYLDDTEAAASAIVEFLRETEKGRAAPWTAGVVGPEREVEVLRRPAAGKTNGEIAAELTLSIRTDECHIGNSYAKIDARGRAAGRYGADCGCPTVQHRPEDDCDERDGHKEVCVVVDGPPHDQPVQVAQDQSAREVLEDRGHRVIVIRSDRSLDDQIDDCPEVFGTEQCSVTAISAGSRGSLYHGV